MVVSCPAVSSVSTVSERGDRNFGGSRIVSESEKDIVHEDQLQPNALVCVHATGGNEPSAQVHPYDAYVYKPQHMARTEGFNANVGRREVVIHADAWDDGIRDDTHIAHNDRMQERDMHAEESSHVQHYDDTVQHDGNVSEKICDETHTERMDRKNSVTQNHTEQPLTEDGHERNVLV
jgi:hypothetical protein